MKRISCVTVLNFVLAGADVIHPGPGNMTTPSFAALTASVDSKGIMYIAEDRVQQARQEIIADLGGMAKVRGMTYWDE